MRIGVIGSGTMGRGIAALSLWRGFSTTLLTRQDEMAAHQRVQGVLGRYLQPEDRDASLERLSVTTSVKHLTDCDIVIESIVEDLNAKQELFLKLHAACRRDTILASNTSVLGGKVFATLPLSRRRRSAVLHFFNPVFRMELVEVNVHADTALNTQETLETFARQLGKQPVRIPGINGGIVSRLVLLMMNEAARLVESGLEARDVDETMEWGAHHPMGPCALADIVGIDVVLQNLENLHQIESDPRFAPAGLFYRLVSESRLGRKSGLGFYAYPKRGE